MTRQSLPTPLRCRIMALALTAQEGDAHATREALRHVTAWRMGKPPVARSTPNRHARKNAPKGWAFVTA